MAYDDSEALQPDNSYGLGGYTFDLNVSYIHEPDEDLVAVSAICNGPDGRRESAPIYVPNGATIESWSVEADETEVSVYVTFGKSTIESVLITTDVNDVFWSSSKKLWRSSFQIGTWEGHPAYYCKYDPGTDYVTRCNGNVYAANVTGDRRAYIAYETDGGYISFVSTFNLSGTNMIFAQITGDDVIYAGVPESRINPEGKSAKGSDFDGGERLVARFAIDIHEADGGPDGDWDEPGDYDPEEDPIEWGDPDYPDPDDPDYPEPIEPGEPGYPDPDDPDYPGEGEDYHPPYEPPQKTLHLTITGATTGTHLTDNVPAENTKAAGYGCGGFGGHGGAGGAGASTVVIHKFATNKANSKEVTAIARSHGYGSGGGKGGKGGDGCILVYW